MIIKYVITFVVGITFSIASIAFFNMMQMPQKMMQMGQQFVSPECSYKKAIKEPNKNRAKNRAKNHSKESANLGVSGGKV